MDRINQYSQLDRERLINDILELYDFVLGSLLDAGMTQKQSVIFRYITRLLLHIPNATIPAHEPFRIIAAGPAELSDEDAARLESGTAMMSILLAFHYEDVAGTRYPEEGEEGLCFRYLA